MIVHGILCWNSGARLDQRLSAIREDGDPLSLAELARESIAPEQNGATFLRRAAKGLAAIDKEFVAKRSKTLGTDNPTDEDINFVKSTLAAYPDVMTLIEKAAMCPDFDSQRNYVLNSEGGMDMLLDDLHTFRMVYRVLDPWLTVLLSENKPDEAMQRCVQMFRLTRHFDREPTLVGYLVSLACRGVACGMANRILNHGPLPVESRQLLEEELAKHDDMQGFVWALKSERAVGCEHYRSIINREGWVFLWYFANDQCDYLDLMRQQIKMGAAPQFKTEKKMAETMVHVNHYGRLTQLIVPAVAASREAMNRVRATIRCVRVLNAVQMHVDRTGVSDPKLTDLGLPADTIVDPYDGKSLRIKKAGESWIVYSIGKNLKDDGGQLEHFQDVGVGG